MTVPLARGARQQELEERFKLERDAVQRSLNQLANLACDAGLEVRIETINCSARMDGVTRKMFVIEATRKV